LFPGASWWVAAVLLTMPVREVALAQFGRANLRIGDVVLACALALWLASAGSRGRLRIQFNGLDRAILVFLLVYASSMLWTIESEHGWVRILKLTRNTLLYALLVNYLRVNFRAGFRTIAVFLVVSGLMQSAAFLYSIREYGGAKALGVMLAAETLVSNDPQLAVVKSESSAGLFLRGGASWFPLCMFFGIAIAHRMKTVWGSALVRAAVALMAVLTLLTFSRGAWISLAVAIFVLLVTGRRRRALRRVFLLASVFLVVAAAGGYAVIERIVRSRFSSVEAMLIDPSILDRMEYFRLALERFRISSLLGGGAAGIAPSEFIIVHNVYLQVLGELGLLGVVVFGIVLWKWANCLLRARGYSSAVGDHDLTMAVTAMLGVTAFFLTYFLIGHDLESGEPWIVMAMSSALYASTRARVSKVQVHAAPVPSRAPVLSTPSGGLAE
jgi:O-antigen ligase